MRTEKLGNIAEINPRLTRTPQPDEIVSFLSMANVSEDGTTSEGDDRPYSEVRTGYTQFLNGDILVAKITPCFENGKIAQARTKHSIAAGSTEFHVIRPDTSVVDARYLTAFLRQRWIRRVGERRMTGSAGQRRLPADFLAKLEVPIPPLAEQQRVANLLARADVLRAKRRDALTNLDQLARSIFIEMFGPPKEWEKQWRIVPFLSVLTLGLRNGTSPSSDGDTPGKVLTLSAITGSRFDPTAAKPAMFRGKLPDSQYVKAADFLICRGNGNLDLVGRGHYPLADMPDTVFPDTIIAARTSPEVVDQHFLSQVWNSTFVRKQIEAAARTTNGTFKLNQTMINGIAIPLPPIELQHRYGERYAEIARVASRCEEQATTLGELFESLQARAFRGEL